VREWTKEVTPLNEVVAWVDPKTLRPHPDRERLGSALSNTDGRYLLIKDSIEVEGIQVPLKAQRSTSILLAGHTRQRIALELELKTVPVVWCDVGDEEALFTMAIDNHLRRGDEQDPIKLAETFRTIMRLVGYELGGERFRRVEEPEQAEDAPRSTRWTLVERTRQKSAKEIAERFGVSRANFFRYLELLNLIPELQALVSSHKLGVKAGAILSKLPSPYQEKVYASIPQEQRSKAEYRLSEKEAHNFAEIYAAKVESENTTARLDTPDASWTLSGPERDLDAWGKSDLSVENAALYYLGDERRQGYLRAVNDVDSEYGEERANDWERFEGVVQEMAEKVVLMDDEATRSAYSNRRLNSTLEQVRNDLQRFEMELVSLRVLVGDRLEPDVRQAWQRLTGELQRMERKLERLSEWEAEEGR
jgi:ParB family chromosome partitioning protein